MTQKYFKSLYETGVAYQIQDSLSDFLGLKERGLPGRDLKEGKNEYSNYALYPKCNARRKIILQKSF